MKIKQGKPFVIMSSNNINQLASDVLALGFKFKYVHGKYNGHNETSLLIPVNLLSKEVLKLWSVAMMHKQESYLVVDSNRDTTLHYVFRPIQLSLGKFVRIRDCEVNDYQSWTQDTKTGQYWTAKRAA